MADRSRRALSSSPKAILCWTVSAPMYLNPHVGEGESSAMTARYPDVPKFDLLTLNKACTDRVLKQTFHELWLPKADSMTDKRIVLTTCTSQEEAENIAHHLVEHRMAACVNVIPQIKSIYRWQGKVESAQEWLLLVKTSADKFAHVRDAIRELHSYELPECVAIPIEDGSAAYLEWITISVE
jgi:periplasmic divalent cation tolerance protein